MVFVDPAERRQRSESSEPELRFVLLYILPFLSLNRMLIVNQASLLTLIGLLRIGRTTSIKVFTMKSI